MRLTRRRIVGGLIGLGASTAGVALIGGCGLLSSSPARVPRIGFVYSTPLDARAATRVEAFRAGLRDHGYEEGQNIHILWRFSASQTNEDVPAIIRELIEQRVDLLAISNTPPTQAAKQATSTIPIIGIYFGDPLGTGLVNSVARPGGNLTGLTAYNYAMMGKRVELLRALAPGIARIGFVLNLGNDSNVINLREFGPAAEQVGAVVRPIGLRTLGDLEPGIEAAIGEGIDAIVVTSTGSIPPADVFTRLVKMATQHGLPTLGFDRGLPDAGGLISQGVEILTVYRRAGYYVDRILKGTSPADLPIEIPSVFEVVLNRTTAETLGITIPPDVVAQVSEWLQ